SHPASHDERVFRTSGTTGIGVRGLHPFRTTATYELAALSFARRMLWPDGAPRRTIVLAPPPLEAPDSSLGFMMDCFVRAIGGPASWHVVGSRIDRAGLAGAVAGARATCEPVLVLGTSFAFVHLVDALRGETLSLPRSSRIMQTGGFKGRTREVEPELLRS